MEEHQQIDLHQRTVILIYLDLLACDGREAWYDIRRTNGWTVDTAYFLF